jgi:uncharacterized protein (DUF3820 family)
MGKKIVDKSNKKMIMPFGVNMGDYVEDLDHQYLKWLTMQQWVEDKFPKLYRKAQRILDEG